MSDPSSSSAPAPQVYGRVANRITAMVLLVSFLATIFLLMANQDTFVFATLVMVLSAFVLIALPALLFVIHSRPSALPLSRSMRAAVLISALGILAVAVLLASGLNVVGLVAGVLLGAFAVWVMIRVRRAPAPLPPQVGPRLAYAGSMVIGVAMLFLVGATIPKFAGTKESAYQASMKSDLRNLATAQDAYFADSLRYNADLDSLHFSTTSGVSITVTLVDTSGWYAYASHTTTTKRCVMWVGAAPSNAVRGASEGEPKCFNP